MSRTASSRKAGSKWSSSRKARSPAVAELPERQRLAILLNKFHGLGYEELAEAMEMTVPGIKSLLVRARSNVRRRIEPYLVRGTEQKGTA